MTKQQEEQEAAASLRTQTPSSQQQSVSSVSPVDRVRPRVVGRGDDACIVIPSDDDPCSVTYIESPQALDELITDLRNLAGEIWLGTAEAEKEGE